MRYEFKTSNDRLADWETSGMGSNWEYHQGPIKDLRCGAKPLLNEIFDSFINSRVSIQKNLQQYDKDTQSNCL